MAETRLASSCPDEVRENCESTNEETQATASSTLTSVVVDEPAACPESSRQLLACALGLLLLHVTHPLTWQWQTPGMWFPSAGVGFLLAAWLGPRAALLVIVQGVLVLLQAWARGTDLPWGPGAPGVLLGLLDALWSGLEVWAAWSCYFHLGRGLRGLIEPRSATLFLVLVPGLLTFLFAVGHALLAWSTATQSSFWELVRAIWLSRALGIVAFAPPCLVVASRGLARRGWITLEPLRSEGGSDATLPLALGGRLEIAGLALATGILGLFLTLANPRGYWTTTPLAILPLLLIIWASLRQGVRGGTLVASALALPSLILLSFQASGEPSLTLQANLIAQCSTALLVGVSFNWIRASEARYRHVVEHVPVVLYSARLVTATDEPPWPEGVELTFISPACRQVFGREPDALLGSYETWLERVHPEDHELIQAALSQLWRFKEAVTCEYRLAAVSGRSSVGREARASLPTTDHRPPTTARWLRDTFVPLFDEAGQLVGWEGVAQEITEQRNLADDLRRTTGMLHTLVNNLPAGVFFVEASGGRPVLVNARARQLLGQREEPTAGLMHLAEVYRLHRPDGTLYPADQVPVCAALRRGTTSVCDDIVVHRPDGQRVPLVSWATPIDLGGLGRYDAVVWVLEDLTALRKAEKAQRESEARLRSVLDNMEARLECTQRQGLVGQLSGGLAHDFNNYLTVVMTSADMALRDLPQEHPLYPDLRNILQASEKASQLARQLTSLSKCQTTPNLPLDLNALIQRTVRLVQGTLGRNVHVRTRFDPKGPVVHGHETELQQVLINLCLNARDAMPEGGQLNLTTDLLAEEPSDNGAANVVCTAKAATDNPAPGWVRLTIRDSGRGISEDVRKNLFVKPVSDKECGAGLGLWMSSRIILDHGGRVAVQSEPGRGTCIEVLLPVATPEGRTTGSAEDGTKTEMVLHV